MFFLQPLNLAIDIILLLPRRLDLVLRVLCHFLQFGLIQLLIPLNLTLELLRLLFLRTFQLVVFGALLHHVLGLVGVELL